MRLFVAIDLPDSIINYCREIQEQLPEGIRRTNAFHLTLKFLGDVQDPKPIIEQLSTISFDKFTLTTTELGAFPNKNYIKVLWIGLEENKTLLELQKNIEQSLQQFNFKKEFTYHPHITLARVPKKITFPDIKTKELTFPVNSFALYQSTLTPQGPIYTLIKEFKKN